MKGIWDNSEVRALFDEVEECKNKNKTLREAFLAHAEKFNRKPNSVRNYYYHEVDELGKDEVRLKSLGINLEKHKKTTISYFSQDEENMLMKEISRLASEGVSVRKACLMLSKGDVGQMLRFQNKYRNFLAKQKVGGSCEEKNSVKMPAQSSNVITFKKTPKTLSDSDVQSLFMGLVRLVKKNAAIEGEEKYKQELVNANNLLRRAMTQISSQERELERLKADYSKIKNENLKLTESVLKNKCNKASALREKFLNKEKAVEIQ